MTTEAPPNPRHVTLADELLKALEASDPDKEEDVVQVRIVLRHGIARKVKWTHESEACI